MISRLKANSSQKSSSLKNPVDSSESTKSHSKFSIFRRRKNKSACSASISPKENQNDAFSTNPSALTSSIGSTSVDTSCNEDTLSAKINSLKNEISSYQSDSLPSSHSLKEKSTLSKSSSKSPSTSSCIVYFIDSNLSPMNVPYNKNTQSIEIFNKICSEIGINEKDSNYFGLIYVQSKHNQPFWIDISKNFHSQLKKAEPKRMILEVKYFIDNIDHNLTCSQSRNLFFFQIRQSILSHGFPKTSDEQKNWIVALIVNEDFIRNEFVRNSCNFAHQLLSLFPISTQHANLDRHTIFQIFEEIEDLDDKETKCELIKLVISIPTFADRFYSVKDIKMITNKLAITVRGISLFDSDSLDHKEIFDWNDISKLSGSRKHFFVEQKKKKEENSKLARIHKFRCSSRAENKSLLQIAFDSHCFYTLEHLEGVKFKSPSTTLANGLLRKEVFSFHGKSLKELSDQPPPISGTNSAKSSTSYKATGVESNPRSPAKQLKFADIKYEESPAESKESSPIHFIKFSDTPTIVIVENTNDSSNDNIDTLTEFEPSKDSLIMEEILEEAETAAELEFSSANSEKGNDLGELSHDYIKYHLEETYEHKDKLPMDLKEDSPIKSTEWEYQSKLIKTISEEKETPISSTVASLVGSSSCQIETDTFKQQSIRSEVSNYSLEGSKPSLVPADFEPIIVEETTKKVAVENLATERVPVPNAPEPAIIASKTVVKSSKTVTSKDINFTTLIILISIVILVTASAIGVILTVKRKVT